MGVPFVINQLLQVSVTTVDSIMAGADGKLTLAAVAQGASLWMLGQLILIGLAMPLSSTFARLCARNEATHIQTTFQQGVWLAVFLIPLGVVCMLGMPYLMGWIGVDAAIIPPARNYLSVITLGVPFFTMYLPVRFFNEGIGNPKVIMWITALSLPINIGGNYILINGCFGLPKMGATGIAIASVCSLAFIALVGWVYTLKSRHARQWQLLRNFQAPVGALLLRYVKLGIPNAIAFVMEAGMFAAVVLLSGRLGVQVAAANQIALSYASTTFMIPLGLSFALMTRVGMAMGADQPQQARIIGLSGIAMGALAMLCSVLAIAFFGKHIAGLYSTDPDIIQIALGLLSLAAIFQIFDGIQVCSAGALRGLEETKAPMLYAIISYWVLAMPLAVLLAFYYTMGAKGLWIGLICGLSITAFLGARKFIQLTNYK